ncbi:GNAT family N-acetyltransferase [Kitasatospora sp. RB6PN24]|uniref:GNAT family N-acetyltransferase n=1 Tax=Kitasatospora humi TaxID=2893891 RepID=UPI001E2F7842|nr:GNAT family protein [Kitasatospora humi]MCC9312045.1 GNAT family N-acetyltransferase [Kitasatospora humi]
MTANRLPPPVELHAPGLLLSPWPPARVDERDLADLRIGLTDPEQARWNPRALPADQGDRPVLDRVAGQRAQVADGTLVCWALRDPADGRLLGNLGIREIDLVVTGGGRVGYWTMPAARGRGVATAALRLASTWAFGELGLHRIELAHALGNEASCAVARKAGYPLEGVLRQALPDSHGNRHDLHLHARLAGDPEPA